jgi:hypothetical protein
LLDGVTPHGHAKLAVNRLDMGLDRIRRQVQLLADLAQRQWALEQAQHRHLTFGQWVSQ